MKPGFVGTKGWLLPIIIVLLVCLATQKAKAQAPGDWGEPIMLSTTILDDDGQVASARSPVLVSDIDGTVHAIWLADSTADGNFNFDTIVYSSWANDRWIEPVDIVFVQGANLWEPRLTVDDLGLLHLIWTQQSRVWYSQVNVEHAQDASRWTDPIKVRDDPASNASIAVDSNGQIHVSFCRSGEPGYLAYTTSTDGQNWPPVDELTSISGCWIRMAVDNRDRIHLVYSEQPGSGAGSAVYYMRSVTRGITWEPTITIDTSGPEFLSNYGPSWAAVATAGDDQVHIVWDGKPSGQRWHQHSSDGGEAWTTPENIDPVQRGLTEANALIFDSKGVLHMLSMGWLESGDRPFGAFYAKWQEGQWSPIEKIGSRTDWDAEGPALAIANGNRLIASWRHREGEKIEVWSSTRTIDAPYFSGQGRDESTTPVSTQAQPLLVTAVQDKLTQSQSATMVAPTVFETEPTRDTAINPVLFALIAVILILATVLIMNSRSRNR